MFHFHSLVIGILASAVVIGQSSTPPDVRTDLAARGLGLSSLTGGNTRRALYFDKSWHDTRLELCCAWGGIEIATDGTLIGGNTKGLVILDPGGHVRMRYPEPAYTAQISWNHKTNKVISISPRDTKQDVLQLWTLGEEHFTDVDSIPLGEKPNDNSPPTTIAWSADGSEIAYSKSGTVLLYSLAGQKSVSIAEGTNPSWSPDGKWIAYRDREGRASMVDPRSGTSRLLIPSAQILRGIRWSPDSQFVLVTVLRPRRSFYEQTEFLIYRIADGKALRIDPLIGGTTEDRVFWVVKPG